MTQLILDISMSLDGYVAGPEPSLDDPLGRGGERLHDWVIGNRAWREQHGMEGGGSTVASELIDEYVARQGATIMGRRMFSGGAGPWEDDPNANGWWGEEPPFHHPVFVLPHHAREPLVLSGTTFTFVTDGSESALAQARDAAGGKDVAIGGGGGRAAQYLRAGVVDELQVHVAPVLLGAGTRLFENVPGEVEAAQLVESPTGVAHLRCRRR